MCLFFAFIRCACVNSELWTRTLRSLCPYQPRLAFINYKVTVVIYLCKTLTLSHNIFFKFLPPLLYVFSYIPMSHVTCHMPYHMFCQYVLETIEMSVCKTIQGICQEWYWKLLDLIIFNHIINHININIFLLFWDKAKLYNSGIHIFWHINCHNRDNWLKYNIHILS